MAGGNPALHNGGMNLVVLLLGIAEGLAEKSALMRLQGEFFCQSGLVAVMEPSRQAQRKRRPDRHSARCSPVSTK